jgi:hypothetical protein
MADDAAKVATTYFDAWKVNEFDTMRSLVADDVAFVGTLARLKGIADFIEGIKGMLQIKSDLIIHKVFVDGPDVLTWFDLHTTVASPVPVANWLHVEDGKRVASDARELAPWTGGVTTRRGRSLTNVDF